MREYSPQSALEWHLVDSEHPRFYIPFSHSSRDGGFGGNREHDYVARHAMPVSQAGGSDVRSLPAREDRCACGCRLSRYNDKDICAPCERKHAEAAHTEPWAVAVGALLCLASAAGVIALIMGAQL